MTFDTGLFDTGLWDDPVVTGGGDDGGTGGTGGGTTGGGVSGGVAVTTYTFFPRTVSDVPPVDADTTGPRYRLFRHYRSRPRGENVWELTDGTFTDHQPFPTIGPEQALSSNEPPTYRRVFWGGHIYDQITQEDADRLQAAGAATLDVNLFLNSAALPSQLVLTSDGRFLFLMDPTKVLTFSTEFAGVVLTSDSEVLFTEDGEQLVLE